MPVDRPHDRAGHHDRADVERRAEGAGHRRVDEALAPVAAEFARLARVGTRAAGADRLAEIIAPGGLDDPVGVLARDEVRAQSDRHRREAAHRLGRDTLAHPRVDEHVRRHRAQHLAEVRVDHRDRAMAGEHDAHVVHRPRALGQHVEALDLAFVERVDQRGAAPRVRGLRVVVHDDAEPRAEEFQRDRGADVADAAYEDRRRHAFAGRVCTGTRVRGCDRPTGSSPRRRRRASRAGTGSPRAPRAVPASPRRSHPAQAVPRRA